jgi:hypothetical protein
VLDEKKCGNLKQTILFIQQTLKNVFNLTIDEHDPFNTRRVEKPDSGDDVNIAV